MNILVAQLGARRHYAVPLAYFSHEQLLCFCTDTYLGTKMAKWAAAMAGFSGMKGMMGLAGRTSPTLPRSVVRTFPLFGLEYKRRVRQARTPGDRTEAWLWGGEMFCELSARELTGACTAVYAYTSAAKELFEKAKALKITTVLDYATAPRRYETDLVSEEEDRFPGWALSRQNDPMTDRYQERQIQEHSMADIIVCASTFVKRAVENLGADREKTKVVPLGIDDRFFLQSLGKSSNIGKLKVLYVGGDGLRKGIGYLAKALDLLPGNRIEARAAGDLEVSETALAQLAQNMDLLGSVPRTSVSDLFMWADVLVLPSISDTFGLVVLEAMAAGIPVVTTPHTCGPDVIRDGIDGYIVPIRDPEAIAVRLDQMAGDRDLLQEMSRQAVGRARDFTISRYAERLINATAH